MGQAFMPIIQCTKDNVSKVIKLHPHKFNEGYKLTDFGYEGSVFVKIIEHIVAHFNQQGWNVQVVFGGDYANPEMGEVRNLHDRYVNCLDLVTKVSADDYDHLQIHVYGSDERIVFKYNQFKPHKFRYLVNESKQEYVKLTEEHTYSKFVLLTADGNEQGGGGTYCGKNKHLVGIWARNMIRFTDKKPEGYKLKKYNFVTID